MLWGDYTRVQRAAQAEKQGLIGNRTDALRKQVIN